MRLGITALILLLGWAFSATRTRADYVIIIANTSQSKDKPEGMGAMGNTGGTVGQPNVGGGAGALGGQIGFIGAAGASGAMGNSGGAGGRQMGGEPMANMGMMGATGGPPAVRAMAVIETSNPPLTPLRFTKYLENNVAFAFHKWGKSYLFAHDVDLQILPGRDGKALPPVSDRFKAEQKRVMKDKSSQGLLDLAEWALTHGLLTDFRKTMADLVKVDPTHPSAIAFAKVEEDLKNKPSAKTQALKLQNAAFKAYKIKSTDLKNNELFYALLHKSREDSQEVVDRVDYLTENLFGFYYWYALKGKALPVPKEKLVAVLAPPGEASDSFFKHHSLFDQVALTADSFYSPRHNVVVFSSRRLDRPFEGVSKIAESYWTVYKSEAILKGGGGVPNRKEGEFQIASTYAVLLKAMEDDGVRAAVSHSGTRQLLVSTGMVPRTLDIPKWLQHGMGGFMQVPYGSPWRGFGAPNWSMYLTFNDLKKAKQLEADEVLLKQVITDKLFEEGTRKNPTLKARSTAWSLVYYLTQKRLKDLDNYHAELSRLPRDLELDADTLLGCFARAFGCVDANNKPSEEKLKELAGDWMSYILNDVKLDTEAHPIYEAIYKLQNELAAELKEAEKPKTGTPMPTTPGATPNP